MAKHARRPLSAPEAPEHEPFLEIGAAEFNEALQDPVVVDFAQRADAALRDAERRGEISLPD